MKKRTAPRVPDDLPRLPPRQPDGHKGDFGRALLIGGSTGMAGAIGLAGRAALCSGAGLVTLAVPRSCQPTVAGYEPCYTTVGLAEDEEGCLAEEALPAIQGRLPSASCLAIGPGLGACRTFGPCVLWMYHYLPQPIVIDADGLNLLATQRDAWRKPAGPRVLTPHPGEFRRLAVGLDGGTDRDANANVARAMAAEHGWVLVLKGHRTLVTDGAQVWHNETGNPGMATGGSGDVLTGVITALMGQGLSAWDAARLAVYVHGLAGDLAAARLGQISLIARDLLDDLPLAFQKVHASP